MTVEYPKIETLFNRDEKTFVVTDELRDPAFAIPRTWLVTEKVDGTNIRVSYDPSSGVTFYGRTDRADIPPFLRDYLVTTFPVEKFASFDGPVTLYGEGYGARIQKGGGNYRPDGVTFRLFDVVVEGTLGFKWWLNWQDVEDVAAKMGIETVPTLTLYSLADIVAVVRDGLPSIVSLSDSGTESRAEGIVARTDPYLFMRNGQRLVFKLKTKDFVAGKR